MRPIRIEFVKNTIWQRVWLFAALLCATAMGVAGFQWLGLSQDMEAEKQSAAILQQQIQSARTPVTIKADPRSADAAKVAQLLQQDHNAAFSTIENLKIPGVRLMGFVLDSTGDTVKLDYEMDTLSQAAQVTEQLNSGYASRPWKLNAVNMNAVTSLGVVGNSSGVQGKAYRATWTARRGTL